MAMEGGGLPVTMRILFLTTALALIPVLTGSIGSPLDTISVADPMVESTGLTSTAVAKGNSCNRRYAGKQSPSTQLKLAKLRGTRDLSTTFHHRKIMGSASSRTEVEVLTAFKEGIIEDPLGALNSWNSNDSTACHWKGVICNSNSERIIALELPDLNLVGSISWFLGSLQYLQNLDLSGNSFNGEIPISLTNCSNLSELALNDNNLTGQIPAQLGNLLNLKYLNLSGNGLLGGIIPASLGNCSLLQFLILRFTKVEGSIPYTMGQLTHLEIFNLEGTSVSGSIPGSLGNCSSLTQIWLGNIIASEMTVSGSLSGELPIEMGSLTRLNYLVVQGSYIGGRLPVWIANLTRLTTLVLSHSSFWGEIPHLLGNLPLEDFTVEYNNLTGGFPIFLTNCSNLTAIAIGANSLEGDIPPEIGLLNKLTWFSIGQNSFSGKIPSSLANCSSLNTLQIYSTPTMEVQSFPSWITSLVNLNELNLADMNLQGAIPGDIGKLSMLSVLLLWANNFTGSIPAAIGNCSSLQDLELGENQLSGELPPEIWLLDQMQVLLIDTNYLAGSIPASVGNFSQLVDFECYENDFTGVIPMEIGSLENLLYLDMQENNFSGYIPTSIGNLSTLEELEISQNQLTGAIPTSMGNLTALQRLQIFQNTLQGSIPVDLMRCTQLSDLELFGNSLSGNIPDSIDNLQSLQTLFLNNNKLSGEVPGSLGRCINLLDVDLSHNSLNGALSSMIFSQPSSGLTSWNVSHNRLSGILPQELGTLGVVTYLDFSANNFSGSIPTQLGGCVALISLDLSVNGISGSIPQSLSHLNDLKYLNVSDNYLQGPIPSGGIFASNNLTAASFVGNGGLCGSILGRPCADVAAPAKSAHPSSCKGFHCARITIAVACSAAGLLLAVVSLAIWWFLFRKGKSDFKKGEEVVATFERGLRMNKEGLLTIIERAENIIGFGAKSTVYKGVLGGDKIVAIKTLSIRADDTLHHDYRQVEADLMREAQILSKLRHRNILKVLGFFRSEEVVALISEFMPRGSLNDQLYAASPNDGFQSSGLNWEARLNIAGGVAHGLVYLHNQFHEPVIHRDLKPSNIFLDESLVPKLGDFGVSRFASPERNGEITATTMCGTVGYIPPEYGATTRVSTKGDVFSYGVVLLELLTRRHPILSEGSETGNSGHLVDWVLKSFEKQPIAVMDSALIHESVNEENQMEQMKLLMRVGLFCTQEEPENRPHMTDVLGMVNQIIEIGSEKMGSRAVAELAEEILVWGSPEAGSPFSRSS